MRTSKPLQPAVLVDGKEQAPRYPIDYILVDDDGTPLPTDRDTKVSIPCTGCGATISRNYMTKTRAKCDLCKRARAKQLRLEKLERAREPIKEPKRRYVRGGLAAALYSYVIYGPEGYEFSEPAKRALKAFHLKHEPNGAMHPEYD